MVGVVLISMNAKSIRIFASETAKMNRDPTGVLVLKATHCRTTSGAVRTLTNARPMYRPAETVLVNPVSIPGAVLSVLIQAVLKTTIRRLDKPPPNDAS